MYRLGERLNRKRKKRLIWLVVVLSISILLAVLFYFIYQINHVKTTIKQSKGTVTMVVSSDNKTIKYDEGIFAVSLPQSWQVVNIKNSLYKIYSWKSVAGTETFNIYLDTISENLAVNRELAIQPEGNKMSIDGLVSDNCINFTKAISPTVGTPAKWQGVDFLCDESNFERDVVGTGSTSGVNTVELNGPASGTHNFFFTYDNTSINPDFTTFYQILNSFYVN